jgi:hypothetical protein
MTDDMHGFDEFMSRREDAARAFVRGEIAPLDRITAHDGAATFFGPNGGYTQGAAEVLARYTQDCALFEPGSESRFEILEVATGEDIAYWTGFQRVTRTCAVARSPFPSICV